ncbi:MAG: TetR/AcrR family transcriptional regulator [Bacteroidota bacterium]
MKVRKRETPELRKNQIIAAADLVLLEVGIDRFTVDQVIEKAGIAKGTVYNYYKNKDEMLAELGAKAIRLLYESFKEATSKTDSYVDKVKSICYSHYDYTKRYPAYSDLISHMERPEFDLHIQKYIKISYGITDFIVNMIKEGQKVGEIKQDIDPHVLTYISWASNVGVVQFLESKKNMLKNHHEISTQQMVETFADMITEGIRN